MALLDRWNLVPVCTLYQVENTSANQERHQTGKEQCAERALGFRVRIYMAWWLWPLQRSYLHVELALYNGQAWRYRCKVNSMLATRVDDKGRTTIAAQKPKQFKIRGRADGIAIVCACTQFRTTTLA